MTMVTISAAITDCGTSAVRYLTTGVLTADPDDAKTTLIHSDPAGTSGHYSNILVTNADDVVPTITSGCNWNMTC